ncbi:MAG: DoxX family protein [Vicinamibacterales bacterium]
MIATAPLPTAQLPTTRWRGTFARLDPAAADLGQAVLRVTLGAVLLPHGAQHLIGWFGGFGFSATLAWMTGALGFPAPLAAVAIVLEVMAPVALILGIASRAAGLAMAGFMAVAASTHVANGFFMNWFGSQPAGVEGFEYHLLAVAMALTVAAQGGGAWAIDRLFDGAPRARTGGPVRTARRP